jgi:hypothetical protein
MSTAKTFEERIKELRAEVQQLDDDFGQSLVEETATRLEGCNFAPPVITRAEIFLRLRRQGLLAEIDRILAMTEAEACALAPGNPGKCEDLRVQYITVLIFYYKKLLALRKGIPEEWDEIDELYVYD